MPQKVESSSLYFKYRVPHLEWKRKKTLSSIFWHSFPFSVMKLNNLNISRIEPLQKLNVYIVLIVCARYWLKSKVTYLEHYFAMKLSILSDDIISSCVSINLQILKNVNDFRKLNDASCILHFIFWKNSNPKFNMSDRHFNRNIFQMLCNIYLNTLLVCSFTCREYR